MEIKYIIIRKKKKKMKLHCSLKEIALTHLVRLDVICSHSSLVNVV